MTPAERTQAIYAAVEAFHEKLASLEVESSVVAVSIDDTPGTGYGVSRVKGNSRILLDMIANAVKSLPPVEFHVLLYTMATGEAFAAQRGDAPQPQDTPTKPELVN